MNNYTRNNSFNLSFFFNVQNNTNYKNYSFLSDNDSITSNERPGTINDNKIFFPNMYTEDDKIYDNNKKYYNLKEKEYLTEQSNNNFSIITNENNLVFPILNVNVTKDNMTNYNKINNRQIFKIIKINKRIGRIKKNSLAIGKHDRLSEDNIIRKIKARFLEKLRKYINYEYKKYILENFPKRKIINKWLKKINPKVSRKIKKEEQFLINILII